MNPNDLLTNPQLKNMDKRKLQIILSLLDESKGKNASELMPFILAASSKATSQGASFTNEEISLIINLLKQDMNPQEKKRIDSIVQLMNTMSKNKK